MIIIITHSKVGVVTGRSELVASHDKKDESGYLENKNITFHRFNKKIANTFEVKSLANDETYLFEHRV